MPLAASDEARVRAWIGQAQRMVVLTGAGVSAESGVPTFRDAQTGLWAQYRAEDMATEAGFRAQPQRVWDWYAFRRGLLAQARPNAGHGALAGFAQRHPGVLTLVTQNVDGLHQQAGSDGVLCLHGDLRTDRWLETPRHCCDTRPLTSGRPPQCSECGNPRRPAVVWFGEALPSDVLAQAQQAVQSCDLMLVVGTAGAVYPAAGLAHLARQAGAQVVVINPAPSALDDTAHLVLRGTSAQLLPRLLDA